MAGRQGCEACEGLGGLELFGAVVLLETCRPLDRRGLLVRPKGAGASREEGGPYAPPVVWDALLYPLLDPHGKVPMRELARVVYSGVSWVLKRNPESCRDSRVALLPSGWTVNFSSSIVPTYSD